MAKDETVVETRHGTSLQTDPNISSLTSQVFKLAHTAYCLLPIPYSLKNRTFAFPKNNERQ